MSESEETLKYRSAIAECEDKFSVQLDHLFKIREVENNLEQLYHNRIGALRDTFAIDIPYSIKESEHLWESDTQLNILSASKDAVKQLDMVRLKPRSYQPVGMKEVRESLQQIQKVMVRDIATDLLECGCG